MMVNGMGFGVLTLMIFGQSPHDLDCRGSFEALARVEPTRIFPGEEITLTLRFVALKPWKRGPQRPPLAEDASLLSDFRVRDLPDEAPSRFPEGITGPTGTAWEFSWKLTPMPAKGRLKPNDPQSGTSAEIYPSSVPEIGLILTREDVPWPRLAREMIWVGPFGLTYRSIESEMAPPAPDGGKGWVFLGFCVWVFLAIVWMLIYETMLFRRGSENLQKRLASDELIGALELRGFLLGFLKSKGLVLPAEPDAPCISQAALRADYPKALATHLAEIWYSLDQAAFGPTKRIGLDSPATTRNADLAKKVFGLTQSGDWRFWKRRMCVDIK